MDYTKNLNLKKPNSDDFYNINDQNENMDKIDASIENYHGEVIFTADPLSKSDEPGKWKRATIYVDDLVVAKVPSVGSMGYIDLDDYIDDEIIDFLIVSLVNFAKNEDLYLKYTMTDLRRYGNNTINFGSKLTDENEYTTHHSIVVEVLYKVANEE